MIGDRLPIDMQAASLFLVSWLGRAVLFGTVLAFLTWCGLLPFRRRLRPGLEMALWAIVLCKFLIPTGPSWSFSLSNLCDQIWSPGFHTAVGDDGRAAIEEIVPQDGDTAETGHVGSGAAGRIWMPLLAAVYLAAITALGAIRLQSHRALRARLLALPEVGEATKTLVQRTCHCLGVSRVPLIRISDEASAPFVTGLLRPLLVLSRRQLVRPNELETVIVHEVAHLRRGDLLLRCLQCLAGTLVFFWPIVAWVNRKIDRARESACDQWALVHGRLTPGEYARCLLRAAEPARRSRITYCPACMAGTPSTLERRIDMILSLPDHRPQRSILCVPLLMFLLLWIGFVLTGAAEAQPQNGSKKAEYANTEQDRDRHAQVVFEQVKKFGTGDLDGNGTITKEECWAFLTAALEKMPDKVMKAYPQADHDQDGQLSEEEAFLFSRGDYDFETLHQQMKQAITEAKKQGDEAKAQALMQELTTKEMATWHVILDRRAALLEMVEQPPDSQEVRKAADLIREAGEKAAKLQVASPLQEITHCRQKAAQLRADAAKVKGAEAGKFIQKAEELEQKANELKAKVSMKLKDDIAKCEADGQTERAAQLKEKLAKLEEL